MKFLGGLLLLCLIVYAAHFLYSNGTGLALAKIGEPRDMVDSDASDMIIREGKAEQGVALLEYESAHGDWHAKLTLASMYERGHYLPRDSQKALTLFKQVADLGSPLAANEVGIMYYCGQIGPPDLIVARQWFDRAAARGYTPAVNNQKSMNANRPMKCPAR